MPRKQKPEPEDKELAKQLKVLSANIKRFRGNMKPRKWSQQELASNAKLSMTTVYEIEGAKAADVRLGTIIALARALGKKIGDLVDAG